MEEESASAGIQIVKVLRRVWKKVMAILSTQMLEARPAARHVRGDQRRTRQHSKNINSATQQASHPTHGVQLQPQTSYARHSDPKNSWTRTLAGVGGASERLFGNGQRVRAGYLGLTGWGKIFSSQGGDDRRRRVN
jgi:hypothetical protein